MNTDYLVALYEALMKSVEKKGSLRNFKANIKALEQIVQNYHANNRCIKDLSDEYTGERRLFFLQHYYDFLD